MAQVTQHNGLNNVKSTKIQMRGAILPLKPRITKSPTTFVRHLILRLNLWTSVPHISVDGGRSVT